MADCIQPDYFPASYNGVFFECLVGGSEHGRRGVTGEFPFGEQTAYQDMGIKIRKYSISGRFQGPDCVSQTTALIAAVETPGPGNLIHPTRGSLTVACTDFKVKDDIVQAAGETTFDMEFVDASSFSTGIGSLPIIPGISDFITTLSTIFSDDYTPSSLLFFQNPPVQDLVVQGLNSISTQFSASLPATNNNNTVWQALTQIQNAAINEGTFSKTASVLNAVTFGFAAIDTYAANPQAKFNACKMIANDFAQSPNAAGIAGVCQEAVISLMRSLSAAYMMRAATQIVSKNLPDALNNMDIINKVLFEEQQNALEDGNDDLYIALSTFKAIAAQTLFNYAYNLPPVLSYKYPGGFPSLVVAHDIFGDAAQFQNLEERNSFNFPFALGPIVYASSSTS